MYTLHPCVYVRIYTYMCQYMYTHIHVFIYVYEYMYIWQPFTYIFTCTYNFVVVIECGLSHIILAIYFCISKQSFNLGSSPSSSPGDRLLQGHVLPTGQHHRLQLGGIWLLQQRPEAHQSVSPWRWAPPLRPAGPDSGQHADGARVCGPRCPRRPGQDPAADADADHPGR